MTYQETVSSELAAVIEEIDFNLNTVRDIVRVHFLDADGKICEHLDSEEQIDAARDLFVFSSAVRRLKQRKEILYCLLDI